MSTPVRPTTDLNHTSLVAAVAAESGLSRDTVRAVLRATFDVIGRTVAGGHKVSVTNFGTWSRRKIKNRHNPNTLEPVAPSASVGFRATGRLALVVRAGQSVTTLAKAPKSTLLPGAPTRNEFEFWG